MRNTHRSCGPQPGRVSCLDRQTAHKAPSPPPLTPAGRCLSWLAPVDELAPHRLRKPVGGRCSCSTALGAAPEARDQPAQTSPEHSQSESPGRAACLGTGSLDRGTGKPPCLRRPKVGRSGRAPGTRRPVLCLDCEGSPGFGPAFAQDRQGNWPRWPGECSLVRAPCRMLDRVSRQGQPIWGRPRDPVFVPETRELPATSPVWKRTRGTARWANPVAQPLAPGGTLPYTPRRRRESWCPRNQRHSLRLVADARGAHEAKGGSLSLRTKGHRRKGPLDSVV